MTNNTKAHASADVEDIIRINKESVAAKDSIRIIELSSLGDLIPMATAENIRRKLLMRKVRVHQLTNQYMLQPWTKVDAFVETCMTIRHIPASVFLIDTEVLIFNDTVAIYRVEPDVSVIIIEDAAFAAQQKVLFDTLWAQAEPSRAMSDGSTP